VARRFAERIDGHGARVPDGNGGGSLHLPTALAESAAGKSPVAAPGFRQAADQMPRVVPRWRGRHKDDDDDDDDDFSRLSIAFPRLRRTAPSWPGALRLIADGAGTSRVRLAASVDDASAVDERRERLGFVTRAVARAAAKYAVTKAVKDRKGEVAGTIAELGANLLERADVRSWHLLPQELELIRLRVPPGTRVLWLEVGSGTTARQLQIPNVAVKAGSVTIVPVRIWRDSQLGTVPTDTVLSECVMLECR
jgi:hypothetical protein